jgi:hypothetical protein
MRAVEQAYDYGKLPQVKEREARLAQTGSQLLPRPGYCRFGIHTEN